MILSKKQLDSLPTIEWLFDNHLFENRATGRTTVILYVLIWKAINSPNNNISIIDHFPLSSQTFNYVILPSIKNLLEDIEFSKFKDKITININYRTISYWPERLNNE